MSLKIWKISKFLGLFRIFKKLINTGDTIVEVGGHIGYVSLYFSRLVGPKGKVIIFEPGSNNLPYIKQNIRQNGDSTRNIQLIEAAVGKNKGEAIFYEDLLISG
jgi:FkbM family methyltransferase